MDNLKHIGRVRTTGRKVLVAFRTLPGESDSALVVQTEALSDEQHDSLMKLVESPAGQNSYEFAEVMSRTNFPDGSIILHSLHFTGKLAKVKTSDIEMTPNTLTTVGLDQLNQFIAEQRGISVNDLALGNQTSVKEVAEVREPAVSLKEAIQEPSQPQEPLSELDLAAKLRSQADALYKEAKRLREQAEELVPTKKKSSVAA
jgi:hypothetical protein